MNRGSRKQRTVWTSEQDTQAVRNSQNIAHSVYGGSKASLQHRWKGEKSQTKGKWQKSEDALLLKFIKKHGPQKWTTIANGIPGRNGKQCRERWLHHLDPNVKKGSWTEEEEKLLLKLHSKHGNKWAHIATFMPGRTDNAIKNRWNSSMRRKYGVQKEASKGRKTSRKAPYRRRRARERRREMDWSDFSETPSTSEPTSSEDVPSDMDEDTEPKNQDMESAPQVEISAVLSQEIQKAEPQKPHAPSSSNVGFVRFTPAKNTDVSPRSAFHNGFRSFNKKKMTPADCQKAIMQTTRMGMGSNDTYPFLPVSLSPVPSPAPPISPLDFASPSIFFAPSPTPDESESSMGMPPKLPSSAAVAATHKTKELASPVSVTVQRSPVVRPIAHGPVPDLMLSPVDMGMVGFGPNHNMVAGAFTPTNPSVGFAPPKMTHVPTFPPMSMGFAPFPAANRVCGTAFSRANVFQPKHTFSRTV